MRPRVSASSLSPVRFLHEFSSLRYVVCKKLVLGAPRCPSPAPRTLVSACGKGAKACQKNLVAFFRKACRNFLGAWSPWTGRWGCHAQSDWLRGGGAKARELATCPSVRPSVCQSASLSGLPACLFACPFTRAPFRPSVCVFFGEKGLGRQPPGKIFDCNPRDSTWRPCGPRVSAPPHFPTIAARSSSNERALFLFLLMFLSNDSCGF